MNLAAERAALPREVAPMVAFGRLLRQHGFGICTEQVTTFIEAVGLLGPRSIESIRLAAHAILAPQPERHAEFESLFRQHFHGEAGRSGGLYREEEREIGLDPDGGERSTARGKLERGGENASFIEVLASRRFDATANTSLQQLARRWPDRMPRRTGFRRRPGERGTIDLRRTLRAMAQHEGDVIGLPLMKRQPRPRRVAVLIDISGSMKDHTTDYLRIAHVLAQHTPRVEVLTVGTRVTRITRALARRDPVTALECAAAMVSDWDGGTRLGPALAALLRSPRDASFLRGALVLVLSDGLECGDPQDLVDAVEHLARRCWRLAWATPLAGDPAYRPQTAAMRAMLPNLSDLIDGASIAPIAAFLLKASQSAPPASEVWACPRSTNA